MDFKNHFYTWLLVAMLAMFGGFVDSVRRYKNGGEEMAISKWALRTVGDMVISLFAGFLTFWIFVGNGGTVELTGWMCACIAMAGNLGGKAIDIFAVAWKVAAEKSLGDK